MTKKFLAAFLLLLSSTLCAKDHTPLKQSDVATIARLYQHLPKNASFNERLHYFSNAFMNEPYLLGPLGEGKQGLYNTNPLFRVDAFDCLTYIETVMALTDSNNEAEFQKTLQNIRYQHQPPKLTERNHFTSLDWIPNNTKKGYIKDITKTIKNKNQEPIYVTATATIDKKNWYRTLGKKLFNHPKKEASTEKLFKTTDNFQPEPATLAYLPFSQLFTKEGKPIEEYFSQIPDGTIVMIVRPNWNIKDKIGTNLHISHLGFAERENDQLYFVEASLLNKKVSKTLLTEYLANFLDSPTIKGINLQKVLDRNH